MDKSGHGIYRHLDIESLPNLYVAYRSDLSEGSEVFHSDMRDRFDRNDPEILDAVAFWADLTVKVADCLENGQKDKIGELLNANFDRRAAVSRISDGNIKMIQAARSLGASAKFTGSGGAIVGTYDDENMYQKLKDKLEPMNINIIKPDIVCTTGED
jgi:glucuronokinase